jgi:hypothetical protein
MTNEPEQSARALSSVFAHDSSINPIEARKQSIASKDEQWSAKRTWTMTLRRERAK